MQGNEMLAMVQGFAETTSNQPPEEEQPQPAPVANAVVQDSIQLEILRLLRDLSTQNSRNSVRGGRAGRGGRTGRTARGNGGPRIGTRTPDDASFNRRVTSNYCHTHGACNHDSGACTTKAPGHHDNATMDNCMGGSNAFCQPVAE
jgi:hypothetical protein